MGSEALLNGPDLVFILTSLLKCALVVFVVLTAVAYTVVAERRVSAFIQGRVGPNRVGIPLGGSTIAGFKMPDLRVWGLGQPIADGLKFILKEEFIPASVNKFYFMLAPALAMIPALLTICVVPFGSSIDLRPLASIAVEKFNLDWSAATIEAFDFPAVIANVDVGILFVFAIVSISVYGIVLAGWASNSKFPFLGGIRASAQMISYELSMGLAVVPIFLIISQLNLGEIIRFQATDGWLALPFIAPLDALKEKTFFDWLLWIPLFISFIIFLVAAFAETNRLPFDLAECETELVGGYHTEYAAMKFALFFLGEYAAMIVVSSVMVVLFFGGWSLPFPWFDGLPCGDAAVPWWFGFIHIGVFCAKVCAFLFFFIWIRWTLPRFRYDQLMDLGWKFFIPLGFANIFLAAFIIALK
jgi:NADH-quinone oxidoreductase subunit H